MTIDELTWEMLDFYRECGLCGVDTVAARAAIGEEITSATLRAAVDSDEVRLCDVVRACTLLDVEGWGRALGAVVAEVHHLARRHYPLGVAWEHNQRALIEGRLYDIDRGAATSAEDAADAAANAADAAVRAADAGIAGDLAGVFFDALEGTGEEHDAHPCPFCARSLGTEGDPLACACGYRAPSWEQHTALADATAIGDALALADDCDNASARDWRDAVRRMQQRGTTDDPGR